MMEYKTIRLILGDQLNIHHSWFRNIDHSTLYLLIEIKQETDYVVHHIQKVCAFFAAMKEFAQALTQQGHHVLYLTLDETEQYKNLVQLIEFYIKETKAEKFEYQEPDEYRLDNQIKAYSFPCSIACIDSEHFLLSRQEINEQFTADKHTVMEHFYRRMRKRFNILMEVDKPIGMKWNFDKNNRKKLKSIDIQNLPQPLCFSNDVSEIVQRLNRHRIKTIGDEQSVLLWPINRQQALTLLNHFCQVCLPFFGQFQDAMTHTSPSTKWSLYHSRLSFCLNCKLISPLEVMNIAISHFEQKNNNIDIAQIEGFIRQILGWREYIRAIYWVNMPKYKDKNALNSSRPLPQFFWNGDTKMRCQREAIQQSLSFAYAHHIQRLMVTGNFCLLAEIDPSEVDNWYLGIYIDAIEWVELPNTRGMALFADGGIVGTKPYCASGSYINKMSDYCKHCKYDIKLRHGENSCPLNSLYWHFMNKHDLLLAKNPRTRMILRTWDNMDDKQKQAILDTAQYYLANLEHL
ncbi:(6-4) photolyase [Photobacterium damselae subsp. damselae]|nr:(6-4) photolyase [Photobacterium damselae subsp. damselae]